MDKVITYQHYLNKYKGENPHLIKRDKFKQECRDFVIAMQPNYFAVYRPKKSRISYKNADKLIQKTIARYEILNFKDTSLDEIYYTVEEDRYKASMHMNLVIKGRNINRLQLALAMKRNDKEFYLEPISSERAIAIYVNKHIAKKGINLGLTGYAVKEQSVNEELFDVLDKNLMHPNRSIHNKQRFLMKYQYGWSKHPRAVI